MINGKGEGEGWRGVNEELQNIKTRTINRKILKGKTIEKELSIIFNFASLLKMFCKYPHYLPRASQFPKIILLIKTEMTIPHAWVDMLRNEKQHLEFI